TRLAKSPLRIVVLVLSVGLTWILVSILFGRPGSGFPRIQQLFASDNSFTAGFWFQILLVFLHLRMYLFQPSLSKIFSLDLEF
uniref:Uncharacterized protein n=1 Tax=Sus scrofa TaxID=9823 RepID=A0A4X1TAH0_PIG